jgi:membrane protein
MSARDRRAGDEPETPTEFSGGSWLAAGKRTLKEFKADALTDRAATLTYYGGTGHLPGTAVPGVPARAAR